MKYKNYKVALILMLTIFLYAMTSFQAPKFVHWASASGSSWDGQFPDASGCAVASVTTERIIYPASSKVEMRHSILCNTLWTRTTNTDSQNRSFYANATFKFNVSPSYYTIPSGGKIAKNQSVFSQQRYSSQPFKSCGLVNLINPIPGPVNSPCTTNY
ncbi:MAG: DUF2690 domain-containing protein [Anaerolineales bacterium]|nr:DUF2690 domain-containing protein [Anaerolineales bacterium]